LGVCGLCVCGGWRVGGCEGGGCVCVCVYMVGLKPKLEKNTAVLVKLRHLLIT